MNSFGEVMDRNTLRLLSSVYSPSLTTEEIKINSAITPFSSSFSPQLYVSSAKGQSFQAWFKMCTHEKRRAKPHKSWMLKIYSSVKCAFLLCQIHTPLLRSGCSVVLQDRFAWKELIQVISEEPVKELRSWSCSSMRQLRKMEPQ